MGGMAMEGLMESGFLKGVLDVTTTELCDELVGGVLSTSLIVRAGVFFIESQYFNASLDALAFLASLGCVAWLHKRAQGLKLIFDVAREVEEEQLREAAEREDSEEEL